MQNGLQKTSSITIALIGILVITIIVPDAFAQKRDVTKEHYEFLCHNILKDDRSQWHEFGCVYFPEIWNWINELFSTTSELQTSMNSTITQISDHENRLLILEGKLEPPYVELTVHVHPEKISKDEPFFISGEADLSEQEYVDFIFYDPDGEKMYTKWTNIQHDNKYNSDIMYTNAKWNVIGNYTIIATHGIHIENATIQYLG